MAEHKSTGTINVSDLDQSEVDTVVADLESKGVKVTPSTIGNNAHLTISGTGEQYDYARAEIRRVRAAKKGRVIAGGELNEGAEDGDIEEA